jgi:hypothetical protein
VAWADFNENKLQYLKSPTGNLSEEYCPNLFPADHTDQIHADFADGQVINLRNQRENQRNLREMLLSNSD